MNELASVRIGHVSSVNENNCTVRVIFPDASNLVSGPLQMVMPFTQKNHAFFLPDIGEQVYCLLMGNGIEQGICLGAVYSKNHQVICKNKDRYYCEFEGGAHILVDRKEKFVQILGFSGELIKLKAGDIFIDTPGRIVSLMDTPPEPLREG